MLESLIQHMAANGLPCQKDLNLDGQVHRYCRNASKNPDEWYSGSFIDAKHYWCTYGSWSQNVTHRFRSWEDTNDIDPKALEKYKLQAAQSRLEWEKKVEEKKQCLQELLDRLNKTDNHIYLKNKKIEFSVFVKKPNIVIPIFSIEEDQKVMSPIITCQSIWPDGTKRFYPGLPSKGGVFWFGDVKKDSKIILCEGWATGYSIWKSTGRTVCVCFSATNIPFVADKLLSIGFSSLLHAQDIGKAGKLVTENLKGLGIDSVNPGENKPDGYDFNDLYCELGPEAVANHFKQEIKYYSMWDIYEMDVKEPEFLIPGFLYERTAALLWAMPGVGKSRWLYSLAAKMSTGHDFLWLKNERPLRIFYVDGEQSRSQIKSLLPFIMEIGFPKLKDNALIKENFSGIAKDTLRDHFGESPNLCMPSHRAFVQSQIEHHKPDIVIFDNYSILFEVDGMEHQEKEKSWTTTRKWVETLQDMGCSVILTHHATKTGETFAGLSQMNRFMDLEIALKKKDKENPAINFEFCFQKHRLPPKFAFKRDVSWNDQTPGKWSYTSPKSF